jgi:COMPASS component SWD2
LIRYNKHSPTHSFRESREPNQQQAISELFSFNLPLEQGPFDTGIVGQSLGINPSSVIATQLEFSSDGKNILVTTASDAHYIVDAYMPSTTRFRLVGHYSYGNEPFQSGGEACWTPDGKCIVSGSKEGNIYAWDIAKAIADQAAGHVNGAPGPGSVMNGVGGAGSSLLSANGELRPFKVLKAHGTPSHIVAFNPKFLMMVSGSTELVRASFFCYMGLPSSFFA